MPLRRWLVLTLTPLSLVVAGVLVYAALTWPRATTNPDFASRPFVPPRPSSIVPPYDGKDPVELKIRGMPGLRLYIDPKDQVITPTILVLGLWEVTETYLFLRVVKPGDTFVDAGANVGYYTVVGSRLVGDKGKVYAFEPDPASFALLEKNVRLNGCTNVVLERKALSNRTGPLKLYLAPSNLGDHRIYQPKGESRPSVDVEAVRLDEYFRGPDRRIDILKMDTQGAEGVILEGMTGLLERQTDGPTIFMEFFPHALSGMGTDAGDMLKKLQGYGYRFYDINPEDKKRGLPSIESAELVAEHPVEEFASQTDILALRGGREPPKD